MTHVIADAWGEASNEGVRDSASCMTTMQYVTIFTQGQVGRRRGLKVGEVNEKNT